MAYLPRDEYIDRQNRHDEFLNDELHSIRSSIDDGKPELKEFKDDVSARFAAVDQRFDIVDTRFDVIDARFSAVDARFDGVDQSLATINRHLDVVDQRLDLAKAEAMETKAETMRIAAYIRNAALRNPSLRIRPLVTFRPDQGIQHPNPSFFPRHADEFYSLRNPTTVRQRRMLAYISNFYDVSYGPPPRSESDASDEDDVIIEHPEVTVGLLESILGLNEDNINEFRQKARDYASRPPPPPIKRFQLALPDNLPPTRRQKLELGQIPYGDDATESPKSDLASTRIEWGKRSTTSSKRPTLGEKLLAAEENEREASNAGTTTNPNTSPRQSA